MHRHTTWNVSLAKCLPRRVLDRHVLAHHVAPQCRRHDRPVLPARREHLGCNQGLRSGPSCLQLRSSRQAWLKESRSKKALEPSSLPSPIASLRANRPRNRPRLLWKITNSNFHVGILRPQRDSNSCYSLERAVSWAGLDDGDLKAARKVVCDPAGRKEPRHFCPILCANR